MVTVYVPSQQNVFVGISTRCWIWKHKFGKL